jgi:hypothetical protein
VKTPVYVTSGWDFESHSQGVILVDKQLDHIESGYLTFWKLFAHFVSDALVFNFVINFVHLELREPLMSTLTRKMMTAHFQNPCVTPNHPRTTSRSHAWKAQERRAMTIAPTA